MKGVSKGGPLMCMAYVIVMMFLPMFQLDCGIMTFDWNGVDLVTGSSGPLEDFGDQLGQGLGEGFEAMGESETGEAAEEAAGDAAPELPNDWLVLLLPGLAVVGIFTVLGGSRQATAIVLVLLVAAFVYFAVVGFQIENMFQEQIAAEMGSVAEAGANDLMGPMGDMEVTTRKAGPFWLGLGASVLGLVLVFAGGKDESG